MTPCAYGGITKYYEWVAHPFRVETPNHFTQRVIDFLA